MTVSKIGVNLYSNLHQSSLKKKGSRLFLDILPSTSWSKEGRSCNKFTREADALNTS